MRQTAADRICIECIDINEAKSIERTSVIEIDVTKIVAAVNDETLENKPRNIMLPNMMLTAPVLKREKSIPRAMPVMINHAEAISLAANIFPETDKEFLLIPKNKLTAVLMPDSEDAFETRHPRATLSSISG